MGLPGVRSGLIIANPYIIESFSRINAILHLANGNLGKGLSMPIITNGEIIKLSKNVIRPFYESKSRETVKILEKELKSSQEQAFHEARHDILTGAPNRLYFNEIVSRKFLRLDRHPEETMCLLMIDLDHFKMINDTWGHDAGDKVLKSSPVSALPK